MSPTDHTTPRRSTVANSGDPAAARAASDRYAGRDGDRQSSSCHSRTSCESEPAPKEPCYLYKMQVKETWPAPAAPAPAAPRRDRQSIEADLKERDKELLSLEEKIETEKSNWFSFWDKAKLNSLEAERDQLHERLVELHVEYGAADARPSAKRERPKDRTFSVIRQRPSAWVDSLSAAQEQMKTITSEIKRLFIEWDRLHSTHENTKTELQQFVTDLEEKRRSVDRVKLELEGCRRETEARRKELAEKEEDVRNAAWKGSEVWHESGKANAQAALTESQQKETKLEADLQSAQADHERMRESNAALEEKEADAARDLEATQEKLESETEKLRRVEAGVIEIRNTLESPATINIVAGSKQPWYSAAVKTTVGVDGGDGTTKDAAKPDSTPSISVELDPDNDASFKVRHPGGLPWGPRKLGQYCTTPNPPSGPPGPHPYLDCVIDPPQEQGDWPFPVASAKGREVKFEAWQAVQFDESLHFLGIQPLSKPIRCIRVMKEVMSRNPRTGTYRLSGVSCGYKPTGRTGNITGELRADVVTYPSDSFEFLIKTSAFVGKDYSRESTWSDASDKTKSDSKTESASDAADRHQVTTTHTNRSAFGMVSDSEVLTLTQGTVGDAKKSSAETENIKVEYGSEEYRKDGKVTPRVPAFGSTFFPLCPVDISFKRNDLEDEFTKDAKAAISTVVMVSRALATNAGRLNNFIPSVGWGFKFAFDALKGEFSYYRQHREHTDHRVYPYSKGKVDLTFFSTDVTLYGGVWIEVPFAQFKALVELELKGSFGLRGSMESTHPDALMTQNVGFGATGAVAAKVQIKIVVGNPDWCSAESGLKTGIEADITSWTQHTDGPHVDWNAKFTGVKAFVTAKVLLVASYSYERTFMNETTLATGRLPEDTTDNLLERQNQAIDSLAQEARQEAAKNVETELNLQAQRESWRAWR